VSGFASSGFDRVPGEPERNAALMTRGWHDGGRGAILSPMTTRRKFLLATPAGAAGLLAACRERAGTTAMAGPAAAPAASPRPLLTAVPQSAPVLHWVPRHEDLCYTFGGVPAKQRIAPGTKIVSWTEDCFDGAVKTADDLPSKAVAPGHDNPQTGLSLSKISYGLKTQRLQILVGRTTALYANNSETPACALP